jgi:RNA polymerase sigma-70 factor (ECF subfamily)
MTADTRQSPAISDPDLPAVEAFRRGDPGAFDVLLSRHERRVLRLATRLLGDPESALDAAQETFVKAWRALPRFVGASRFSTWLTRIAINQCRNEIRRRRTVKHTRPLSLDECAPGEDRPRGDSVAGDVPEPGRFAEGRETASAFRAAMDALDPDEREVLILKEVEDMGYEGIAEVLAVPVGTVRSRLHRARAELKRRMGAILGG